MRNSLICRMCTRSKRFSLICDERARQLSVEVIGKVHVYNILQYINYIREILGTEGMMLNYDTLQPNTDYSIIYMH